MTATGKTFVLRRGMTAVPNATIYGSFQSLAEPGEDPRQLSIQALGLLLLMLSRPTGKASQGYRAFQARGMGRDALLKAMRELSAAGLRHQFKRRSEAGTVITDTIVAEHPMSPADAEAAWAELVGTKPQSAAKGAAKPAAKSAPKQRKTPSQHRAPEIGATGAENDSTVRRITVARSTDASSVPDAKVSIETSSQEPRDNQKANDDGQKTAGPQMPPQSGATAADDATTGEGRAKVQAMLQARREQREMQRGQRRPVTTPPPAYESAGQGKNDGLRPGLYEESRSGHRLMSGSPVGAAR